MVMLRVWLFRWSVEEIMWGILHSVGKRLCFGVIVPKECFPFHTFYKSRKLSAIGGIISTSGEEAATSPLITATAATCVHAQWLQCNAKLELACRYFACEAGRSSSLCSLVPQSNWSRYDRPEGSWGLGWRGWSQIHPNPSNLLGFLNGATFVFRFIIFCHVCVCGPTGPTGSDRQWHMFVWYRVVETMDQHVFAYVDLGLDFGCQSWTVTGPGTFVSQSEVTCDHDFQHI